MSFFENIKHPEFFPNFLKVAIPFFVIVTLVSLLINSFSEITSGDFDTLVQNNFANDKWKSFFGFKVVFSVFYGLYITNKKMK